MVEAVAGGPDLAAGADAATPVDASSYAERNAAHRQRALQWIRCELDTISVLAQLLIFRLLLSPLQAMMRKHLRLASAA